jgi:hypothetical protein
LRKTAGFTLRKIADFKFAIYSKPRTKDFINKKWFHRGDGGLEAAMGGAQRAKR